LASILVAALLPAMTLAAPAARAASTGSPVGSFDSIAVHPGTLVNAISWTRSPTVWTVYGWAADPDAPNQAIPVHVYVNGVGVMVTTTGCPQQAFAGGCHSRPDVASAVPFAQSNMEIELQVPMHAGDTVCLYAINVGPASANTALGCRRASDAPGPGDPIGSWDTMTAHPGFVRIAGWAADPDRTHDMAALWEVVRVELDGVDWGDVGVSVDRPDVTAAFPWAGTPAGFRWDVVAQPGVHQLCLVVANLGTAGSRNVPLGCRQVVVPGVDTSTFGLIGAVDKATVRTSPDLSSATDISGWAYEPWFPGTQTSVHLMWSAAMPGTVPVDGPGGTQFPGTVTFGTDETVTSEPRPDVHAGFPAAGPNSGWKVTTAENPHGPAYTRLLCGFVFGPQPGGPDYILIGCLPNI
jgi:hypothetical protein